MSINITNYVPIPGCEGRYFINEDGDVLTVKKMVKIYNRGGYATVGFYRQGIARWRTVHSLVAEVFIGPRPENLLINHRDGNKKNNNVANLEYCTGRENVHHAMRMGLKKTTPHMLAILRNNAVAGRGKPHVSRRLTPAEIERVKTIYQSEIRPSMKAIGNEFGVSASIIHRTIHGYYGKRK
ncbi:MAG: hypothetical protein JWQ87_9 [Candidatus Sulfotelmatobacter sp.]|nr:hypothetical protein [Candidatus Sulfotelmatobacter sp.]